MPPPLLRLLSNLWPDLDVVMPVSQVVEQGGDDDGGLSQGAKIGIGVGVGVGGAALLSGLAYVFLAKKKKGASKAVGVSGGANNA